MSESTGTSDEAFDAMMKGEFATTAIFFDSARGRSVFAYGAAYVLKRLRDDPSAEHVEELIEAFRDFTARYMGE